MLDQIAKLFKSARKTKPNSTGYAHSKHTQAANSQSVEWEPLDVSKLNITSNRVREIEASMVKNARSEFTAVTNQLKSSQNTRKR